MMGGGDKTKQPTTTATTKQSNPMETITCLKCKELPQNPVESNCCSALYCWECVVKTESCFNCNAKIYAENCRLNLPLKNVLEGLEAKCRWEGCKVVQSNLREHEKECPFALLQCPNSENCGFLSRKDFKAHKEECLYRNISCPLGCGSELPLVTIEHHIPECERRQVNCPNDGCGTQTINKELKKHLEGCPFTDVVCKYEAYGCNTKVSRKDYKNHLNEDYEQHLSLLANSVQDQQAELVKLNKTVTELRTSVQSPRQRNSCCLLRARLPSVFGDLMALFLECLSFLYCYIASDPKIIFKVLLCLLMALAFRSRLLIWVVYISLALSGRRRGKALTFGLCFLVYLLCSWLL